MKKSKTKQREPKRIVNSEFYHSLRASLGYDRQEQVIQDLRQNQKEFETILFIICSPYLVAFALALVLIIMDNWHFVADVFGGIFS